MERPRKSHTLPDVLSPGEVKRLIEVVSNLKHRTLLILIYSCSLRIGEALSLTINDIHSDEGLIYLRSGKGKKDRRVPRSPLMLEQLRMYYHSYLPKKYLFEGQAGGKYSRNSASTFLKRAVKKVEITKRVTLHTLRHSYATHITQRRVGLRYVQEILGHNSPHVSKTNKNDMVRFTHVTIKYKPIRPGTRFDRSKFVQGSGI
ncbi:MAG: tyrosine-type recombinase/integrase [Saprospiraceae bacterium]|nr:tyrosine-type recombinase/integrase [Saprospiraceae bacterium]